MSTISLSVLHVTQPTEGGVGRQLLALIADQVERGYDVAVACPPKGELPERAAAAGVRHWPWTDARFPGPGVTFETAALRRIVDRSNADLFHLHSSKAGL